MFTCRRNISMLLEKTIDISSQVIYVYIRLQDQQQSKTRTYRRTDKRMSYGYEEQFRYKKNSNSRKIQQQSRYQKYSTTSTNSSNMKKKTHFIPVTLSATTVATTATLTLFATINTVLAVYPSSAQICFDLSLIVQLPSNKFYFHQAGNNKAQIHRYTIASMNCCQVKAFFEHFFASKILPLIPSFNVRLFPADLQNGSKQLL